jgi:hypothetical protein
MAAVQFPFQDFLEGLSRRVHTDYILSKNATGEVQIALESCQSTEEVSEVSHMLSTFTDSHWNLQLDPHFFNIIQYKERKYYSSESREWEDIEWEDGKEHINWCVLYKESPPETSELIIQRLDHIIVIAHCPEGVDDANREAVRRIALAVASKKESKCGCDPSKCDIL